MDWELETNGLTQLRQRLDGICQVLEWPLIPIVPSASATTATATKKMNRTDFDKRQYELSVMAGMNQRYHQQQTDLWGSRDRWLRIAVGILAVGGSMLSVVTIYRTDALWIASSVTVAGIAAFAAVILNVIPITDRERRHLDMFRRWSDFREEIDSLRFVLKITDDATARLSSLDAKSHRLCALEPTADETLLSICFDKEQRSRQYETTRTAEAESIVLITNEAATIS